MHPKKQTNHFLLSKFPILVVYLLFLAVQIFFNIDVSSIPGAQQNTRPPACYKAFHSVIIKKGVRNSSLQTKSWLNKRFELSNIPCSISPVAEEQVFYIEPLKICPFVSIHYFSAVLCTHALRGPPVVA